MNDTTPTPEERAMSILLACDGLGRDKKRLALNSLLAARDARIKELQTEVEEWELEFLNAIRPATKNHLAAIDALRARLTHADAMAEALEKIADMTDADNPESYRCDDPEGCLDAAHGTAETALAAWRKAQTLGGDINAGRNAVETSTDAGLEPPVIAFDRSLPRAIVIAILRSKGWGVEFNQQSTN